MEKIFESLNRFSKREEGLRDVTRYSLYHTMWYRTNLWTHSRRVAWVVEELAPLVREVFGSAFKADKACACALVHDDPEMLMGDIQAGYKANMSPEQLAQVHELERNAIEQLARQYPSRVGNYEYKDLLLEGVKKSSLEAMVVDWADKYDAFGEALHEIYAGNTLWTVNVVNEYGTILLPTDHYMGYFKRFAAKFPRSQELLARNHSMFQIPEAPNVKDIASRGQPHTAESIRQPKGYAPYDRWVALTLTKGTPEDVANLYNKKE